MDPVFQETVSAEAGLAGHEPFPAAAVDAFAQHVPLADALATGKAVSVPYADAARGTPLIALAVRVPGRKDAAGKERPWVVAVEVSLVSVSTVASASFTVNGSVTVASRPALSVTVSCTV